MFPRKTLRRMRWSVCALGVNSPEFSKQVQRGEVPDSKIFGTGFVIRDDAVLTARHVRWAALRPDLPVLYMSGFGAPAFSAAIPALCFIDKPFLPDHLLEDARRVLPPAGQSPT